MDAARRSCVAASLSLFRTYPPFLNPSLIRAAVVIQSTIPGTDKVLAMLKNCAPPGVDEAKWRAAMRLFATAAGCAHPCDEEAVKQRASDHVGDDERAQSGAFSLRQLITNGGAGIMPLWAWVIARPLVEHIVRPLFIFEADWPWASAIVAAGGAPDLLSAFALYYGVVPFIRIRCIKTNKLYPVEWRYQQHRLNFRVVFAWQGSIPITMCWCVLYGALNNGDPCPLPVRPRSLTRIWKRGNQIGVTMEIGSKFGRACMGGTSHKARVPLEEDAYPRMAGAVDDGQSLLNAQLAGGMHGPAIDAILSADYAPAF